MTQRVGTTDISISYNRPVARGRELFGTVVHWGRRWHRGADSATTISFSKRVTIDGHALYLGDSLDALRLTVTPETGAHMETLAYYFPMVDADSAVLRLLWGTVIVPLRIRTTP